MEEIKKTNTYSIEIEYPKERKRKGDFTFLGRNGNFKCTKLEIQVHEDTGTIIFTPITSAGNPGRCDITAPVEVAEYIAKALSEAVGSFYIGHINVDHALWQDLLITALEGGSNYWYFLDSDAVEIYREYMKPDRPDLNAMDLIWAAIMDGREIPVRDYETLDLLGQLSMVNMERALNKIASEQPEHYRNLTGDSWDAETADVFFQYTVMGEITFA